MALENGIHHCQSTLDCDIRNKLHCIKPLKMLSLLVKAVGQLCQFCCMTNNPKFRALGQKPFRVLAIWTELSWVVLFSFSRHWLGSLIQSWLVCKSGGSWPVLNGLSCKSGGWCWLFAEPCFQHAILYFFKRKEKLYFISIFETSACITFTSILLPQTNCIAKLRVNMGELHAVTNMERHDSLGASILTIPTLPLMNELLFKEFRILRGV